MRIPRDLSGRELTKILCRDWARRFVHQEGSHIILQTEQPTHQRLPVPDHSPLRIGTVGGLLRLVANQKGVTRDDILRDR
jgi:predicted RNA binding protein YcfA (HicA-like mRNA interferase family)